MSSDDIKIPVEKIIHDSLRAVVQELWNKHGICVQEVRFEWLTFPTESVNEKKIVRSVEVRTTTNHFKI